MKTLLVLLLVTLLFAGCGHGEIPQTPNLPTDSVTTVDSFIVKDTAIVTRSLHAETSVPISWLDSFVILHPHFGKQEVAVNKDGNLTNTLTYDNGYVDCDCHTDSLVSQIYWLQTELKQIREVKSKVNYIPSPAVVEYRIPKWCWWMLGIVSLYIIINVLRYIILPRL
jgi:hypothetical protein